MKKKNTQYAVLGKTINAAFVDEILGKNVIFFIDENNIKKEKFREKDVLQPRKLSSKTNVILPYYNNIKIIDRFKKKYKGKFELIK